MTVFRIYPDKKYVQAKRLPFGFISYKNQIINPFTSGKLFIEKKAIEDFHFKVRFKVTCLVIQLPLLNIVRMQKNQKKIIIYKFVDNDYMVKYVSSDNLCFNSDMVEKCPHENMFIVQIIQHGGTIVKQKSEKYSNNIGLIDFGTVVIVNDIELSFIDQLPFCKLQGHDGFIYKNSVRLLGFADNYSIYYHNPNINYFPISCFFDKKCIICEDNNCNSVFIHDNSGHSVTCYECAINVMKYKRCCPICRQIIDKIILLF